MNGIAMLGTWIALCVLPMLDAHAEEIDLSQYEASIYSQHGEDGVLAKLMQLLQPSSQFCVECGARDGMPASPTYLLRLQGWSAVLLDRSHEVPEQHVHKEFIRAENITDVLQKYEVPYDLGLLSIHLGFNDFYVWQGVDARYQPAVVVIEYNATHLPSEDKVVKYQPFFSGDGTNYYGASMLALYHLGRSKGYSLVYAEEAGKSLFFIRDDLLADKGLSFKHTNDVKKIYRFASSGTGPNGGKPQDFRNRHYLTSDSLLN